MSTKTLKKELMAAVAMVLVALIALSGSTYAWFASNTKVEAGNMSISADTADPFLQIKLTSKADTEYGTFATMDTNNSDTELRLVAPGTVGAIGAEDPSSVDDAGWTQWYESISDDPNKATTAASKLAANIKGVTDGAAKYMVKQELTIRNASSIDAEYLDVKATFGAFEADSMDKAIRVLVVAENGKYALFDSTGKLVSDAATSLSDRVLYDKLASNTAVKVVAYMYFDGNDPSAKNVTTVSAVNVDCRLTFTIKNDPDNSKYVAP